MGRNTTRQHTLTPPHAPSDAGRVPRPLTPLGTSPTGRTAPPHTPHAPSRPLAQLRARHAPGTIVRSHAQEETQIREKTHRPSDFSVDRRPRPCEVLDVGGTY